MKLTTAIEKVQDNFIVLYSYGTPVAIKNNVTGVAYRTEERFSNTTGKHIGKFLRGFTKVEECPQSHLEEKFGNMRHIYSELEGFKRFS